MALLTGLESLVESKQLVPADRVRFYVEVLESAAEAREAAAARLRAQIRQTTERYASVFSAVSSSPPSPSAAAAALGGTLDSLEGDGGGKGGVDDDNDDGEEEREEGNEAGERAEGDEKGGDGGGEDSGGGGGGEGGGGGGGNNNTGAVAASGENCGTGNAESTAIADDNTATTKDGEAVASNESQGEGQTQQRDGEEEEEEEGLEDVESRAPLDVVDLDLANNSSKQERSSTGGDKGNGNGGNVFGMAGRFLRGVLHIPPGEDAAAAAAGEGEAVDAASLPTAANGVEIISSPTTPNAIAADSKSDEGEKGDGAGGLEAGRGDEEGAGVEETTMGVSVEGVVVET